MKRNSVPPSCSLDQFLEKQGIHIGGEKYHDTNIINGGRVIPIEDIDEHNKESKDPTEKEEICEDGWLVVMRI